jgi:trk system potassium uptake protein TrkH
MLAGASLRAESAASAPAVPVLLAAAPLTPLPFLLANDTGGWLGAPGQLTDFARTLAAVAALLTIGAVLAFARGWGRLAAALAIGAPAVLVAGLIPAALDNPEVLLLTGVVSALLLRPLRASATGEPPALTAAAQAATVALGAVVIAQGHDIVRYPEARAAVVASLLVAALWGTVETWRTAPRRAEAWATAGVALAGAAALPWPGVTTVLWSAVAADALRRGGGGLWGTLVADLQRQPARLVFLTFVLLSAIGAVLLSFPVATADGHGLDALTATFHAVSAVCVTGLATIDPGTVLSLSGQWILLALIQVGGLGIMTLSAFAAVALGQRLGLRESIAVGSTLGAGRPGAVPRLLTVIVVSTLVIEAVGAALLYPALRLEGLGPFEALHHAVFHAVSAFCNAGFALYPDSLASRGAWTSGVLWALLVVGGLGFTTVFAVTQLLPWRRTARRRLDLQSRVVLRATAALLFVGFVGFLVLEWGNALAGRGVFGAIGHALFQSATPRTAGFATIDYAQIKPGTAMFTTALMFVGASPGGTGGGIKTTTLVVLLLSVRTLVSRRERLEVLGRELPPSALMRAVAIVTLSAFVCFGGCMLLLITQSIDFGPLLFESVSAFATVGLSMGVTPRLDAFGQVVIILLMLLGRTGPLTVALLFGKARRAARVRRPVEDLPVG